MKTRCLITILACAPLFMHAHIQKTIVLFGDSCSDDGNMPPLNIRLSLGTQTPYFALPAAPYSNGCTWITKLGNLWDIALEPSSRGGLNYAFVGAQTSTDSTANLASVVPSVDPPFTPPVPAPAATLPFATCVTFIPSMQTQMNEFLTQRKDVSNQAIIFQFGGVNNFLKSQSHPEEAGRAAADDLISNTLALKNAGFCNQVIINAQNKTLITAIPPTIFALFGNTLNATLLQGLKNTSLCPVVIDQNVFWEDIYSNLSFYGFTGAGGNALYPSIGQGLGPMQTMSGPNNTVLWFDSVHFSERLQDIFSQYVYNMLQAPVYWGHVALQSLSVMRGQNAVLRQELYPLSSLCVGSMYPFFSGSYIPRETAPFIEGRKPHSHGWNATIGAAYRCCPHWSFGIAGSYNGNRFEECDTLGNYRFNLDAWLASVFSCVHGDRGYLNGIFNVGPDRLCIDRRFSAGPRNWHAQGRTRAIQYDLLLEGTWYFHRDDLLQIGPMGTIEYQHVGINGYCEQNALYNNLQYGHQGARSFVTGLGLEALVWGPTKSCFRGFAMELFAQVNEEWGHQRGTVYFRQQSLGDAPYGSWPRYQKRTLFGSFGLSLSKSYDNGTIVHVGYRGNWGQHHMSEQNLVANVTFKF